MDDEPVTKWAHFLWEIKSLHNLTHHIKQNCSVQGLHFHMILQQLHHPERQFRLSIDEIPPSPDAVIKKEFYVTSYIFDKAGNIQFKETNEVTFTGQRKTHNVWNVTWRKILKTYLPILEGDDEIWLIAIFEPKFLIQVRVKNTPLDKNPWNSLDALSRDFCSLIGTQGDFIVRCKTDVHIFHKNILMARCGKLGKCLKDITGGELHLHPSCFDYFMEYIYTGCFYKIGILEADILYRFGLRYELKDLMALCSKILTNKLTKENVGYLLPFAHNSKDEHFKEAIAENILRKDILESKEWVMFSRHNIELALEVYQTYAERLKNFGF